MSRALRILVVTQTLGPAGAERQIAHLATGLARDGHDVTLLCIGDAPSSDREQIVSAGAHLVLMGALTPQERARRLPRIAARARRSDVVVCSSWDATFWGRVAAVAVARPVIVIEHAVYRSMQTSLSGKPRGRWIAAHNRLLDPFTYATVACASAQLPVLRSEGVAGRRIVLIPNGVPVAELRADSRAPPPGISRTRFGIRTGALVLVHVARLTRLKNQQQTLLTARRLRAGGLDVHVLLVGDGEDRVALEAEFGCESWAHLVGAQDRVAPFLGLADLAVLPSRAEAMPMALAEALAVGLPVVASDVGDVGEIVRASGAGIVVPADDPDAFTAACERLLRNGDERRRAADRARAAGEKFDARLMTRRYGALLQAAAARQPLGGLAVGD
jgi:glycosyltransferase involved in cell wall biosynthesis